MARSISSAEPEKLFRYSDTGMRLDHDLVSEASLLASRLQHFEDTCREPGYRVSASHLAGGLRSHGSQSETIDGWVRLVGKGFQMADRIWVGVGRFQEFIIRQIPGSHVQLIRPLPMPFPKLGMLIRLRPVLPPKLHVPDWLVGIIPLLSWLVPAQVLPAPGVSQEPGRTPLEPAPTPVPTPTPVPPASWDKQGPERVSPGPPPSNSDQDEATLNGESESGPRPVFEKSPVPLDKVRFINWYGNTKFAYDHRHEYYDELQGLHSGIDFAVPIGTAITSVVDRTGKIMAVNGEPYDYKAGPGSILVDYGEFLVLYGHTSRDNVPEVGDEIKPDEIVGYTGADAGGFEHLHLEVIKKDPGWNSLPVDKQATTRPGNIRTNPVPYLNPELRKQLAEKESGEFHPTSENVWQTPDDQPDIDPGGLYLV